METESLVFWDLYTLGPVIAWTPFSCRTAILCFPWKGAFFSPSEFFIQRNLLSSVKYYHMIYDKYTNDSNPFLSWIVWSEPCFVFDRETTRWPRVLCAVSERCWIAVPMSVVGGSSWGTALFPRFKHHQQWSQKLQPECGSNRKPQWENCHLQSRSPGWREQV